MQIKKIIVGQLETNCYLLIKDNNCLIIDPGDEAEKIIKEIDSLTPVGIIITHHHFDHVGALTEIKEKYKIKTYDFKNLNEGPNTIKNFSFEVITTPGHKDDCITVYFREDNAMFAGDFIFRGTVGRWDLPTGSQSKMYKSINKIKNYNKEIIIYSGHGPATTLKYEINNNAYFK